MVRLEVWSETSVMGPIDDGEIITESRESEILRIEGDRIAKRKRLHINQQGQFQADIGGTSARASTIHG